MITLEIAATEQHARFIKRVVDSSSVWALNTAAGDWVFSDSNGEEEEGRGVLLVWSDRAYAQRCAVEEWESYVPAPIPLAEFLEAWCAGMHNNHELVGTNWDGELHGLEVEPLALALQILSALGKANKPLELRAYSTITEFAEQVQRAIG